jgi:hypothetical protein
MLLLLLLLLHGRLWQLQQPRSNSSKTSGFTAAARSAYCCSQ